MPFLTEVHFQNYRSFLHAKCRLSPVTVVIGANNAGKSNFLRGLADLNNEKDGPCLTRALPSEDFEDVSHRRDPSVGAKAIITATDSAGLKVDFCFNKEKEPIPHVNVMWGRSYEKSVRLYDLDHLVVEKPGPENGMPFVRPNGDGTVRVLLHLAANDPAKFDALLVRIKELIPEVEKLIPQYGADGKPDVLVKEAGIEAPATLRALSPGSRTILALLTIIHQPNRPELILLEDIEHAIHPRGLAPLVETMRAISKEHGVQFIFTTQSPYVLDSFQKPECWDAGVIVEKRDGVSTLVNAKERLVALGYEREMAELPLGDLWYSGALGGVAGPNELWDEPPPEKKP